MEKIRLTSILFLSFAVVVLTNPVDDDHYSDNDQDDDGFDDNIRRTFMPAVNGVVKETDFVHLGSPPASGITGQPYQLLDDPRTPNDMDLSHEHTPLTEETEHERDGMRMKRKAYNVPQRLWPDAIVPFVIETEAEPYRDGIEQVFEYISNRTCITFIPWDASVAAEVGHNSRLSFQNNGICSSYLGRNNFLPEQTIWVDGCNSETLPFSIYRPVFFALGIVQEERRPDRDQFISIIIENVVAQHVSAFDKAIGTETFGIPYDTSSIMHSFSKWRSANGNFTMVTHDPMEMPYLGNRVAPTFSDIKVLNLLYECPNKTAANCTGAAPTCLNEGYLGEGCTCVCQPQYTGEACESDNPDYVPRCIIRLTIDDGVNGTISSPNYPVDYDPDVICQYVITGPSGSTIGLNFTDFNVGTSDSMVVTSPSCENDYVEVYETADSPYPTATYCGFVDTTPLAYTSNGNTIRVVFKSDSTNGYRGFSANYVMMNLPDTTEEGVPMSCAVSFNSSVEEFNYYLGDSHKANCSYDITVPEGQRVALSVHSLDIEATDCCVNRIEIHIGDGTPTAIKLCGENTPTDEIISAANMMTVIFVSYNSGDLTGFNASYRAVEIVQNNTDPDVKGSAFRCTGTTNQLEGYIQSPRYPRTYPRNTWCGYEITAPAGLHVELTFANLFQLEEEDYICIELGEGVSEIKRISEFDSPLGSYVSLSNRAIIRFQSLDSWSHGGQGFRASFRSVSLRIPEPEVELVP